MIAALNDAIYGTGYTMKRTTDVAPRLSLIVPTRERAAYVEHSLRSCVANPEAELEILVIDNASTDGTREAVARVVDPRIRYVRNDQRLSMRDNFEKGLSLARGDVLCFIGDDDGVFPFAVARALELFDHHDIAAVSAARASYFWPDLQTAKRNIALLPRGTGVDIRDSRTELYGILSDNDYYRLPCLYHGFVKRALVERIRQRQSRFFLSSQVDMFSAIALSMENVRYAFSHAPLVINGGSGRSNGASHFGGGTSVEKAMWKAEDDLGFLQGFEGFKSVGSLIIESAVRYCRDNNVELYEVLNRSSVAARLREESASRQTDADHSETADQRATATGLALDFVADAPLLANPPRLNRLIGAFIKSKPIDMSHYDIKDIDGAIRLMTKMLECGQASVMSQLLQQVRVAIRISMT
jgi:glycosyltransferase involved in cell wall biosynthesis